MAELYLFGKKIQTPRSKIQISSKHQKSNGRSGLCRVVFIIAGVLSMGHCVDSALGVWSLVFLWSLDLGVWCFPQVHRPDARPMLEVEVAHEAERRSQTRRDLKSRKRRVGDRRSNPQEDYRSRA